MKPRIFVDIKSRKLNAFSRIASRINLTSPITRLRLRTPLKVALSTILVVYFIVGFAVAPNYSNTVVAQDNATERAALEQELRELEAQIEQDQQQVKLLQDAGKSLSNEMKILEARQKKLSNQITLINANLQKLNVEINENEKDILSTEERIMLNEGVIGNSLQEIYEYEQQSLMLVLLKNPTLTDFSNAINDLLTVQISLTGAVAEMNRLKSDLLDEKEALAIKKNDAVALKAIQDAQRKEVAAAKSEKNELYQKTKGEEDRYKKILEEKKKDAAQIRNRIFQLLGGGELTFEQAYQFAKFAGDAVGVRPALILAILTRESAFGQNVGRCNYKTAMAPGRPASKRDDVTPFLQITAELGIDPNTIMVSCANRDGAYGGAMGPAQFIPTTWVLYRDRISKVTGSNPPSPWSNQDAFTGTALYLKDSGANGTRSADIRAAATYYAGKYWRRHIYGYGTWVVDKAEQFEEDIAAITGA